MLIKTYIHFEGREPCGVTSNRDTALGWAKKGLKVKEFVNNSEHGILLKYEEHTTPAGRMKRTKPGLRYHFARAI